MLCGKLFGDYTVNDLKKAIPSTFLEAVSVFAEHRSRFKILIIDNEHVAISDTLKSLGYVVSEERDIKTLEEASKFDLILCDKMDVGKFLGANSGGAFLAAKIKERFPFKRVILYSSARLMVDDISALKDLDDVISEAPDTDTFSEYVDDQIKELLDPVRQWGKLHMELVKKEVSAFDIAKIESDYVRQILKRNGYKFFADKVSATALSVAKDVLVSFASQGVFSLFAI